MLHSYVEGEINYSLTKKAEINIKFALIYSSSKSCSCSELLIKFFNQTF